jgi:uncharacterized damage-inducible protein DinB
LVKPHLHELYGHEAWADAEHWRALEAHPEALTDSAIRVRLHHIHLVQAGFLWVVGPRTEQFAITKVEDFASMGDLKKFAQRYHRDVETLLKGMADERWAESIDIPWFKDPPLKITVEQALTQAVMHSHYHRGQNATRLRELGGTPPLTDYIAWLWKGQPAPQWS